MRCRCVVIAVQLDCLERWPNTRRACGSECLDSVRCTSILAHSRRKTVQLGEMCASPESIEKLLNDCTVRQILQSPQERCARARLRQVGWGRFSAQFGLDGRPVMKWYPVQERAVCVPTCKASIHEPGRSRRPSDAHSHSHLPICNHTINMYLLLGCHLAFPPMWLLGSVPRQHEHSPDNDCVAHRA